MLYVVATPIGNLGDMCPRAAEALRAAEIVACEDTRRTRALLSHLEIPTPAMMSYREDNEHRVADKLLEQLNLGKTVALCSSAGYPGISDPGYRILSAAIAAELDVEVVPGASAVPIALLMSGLSSSSYTFKGFPPRKSGAMARFFEQDAELPHTMVIYESPMRVGKTLGIALEALGDRMGAVCIELTKKFERTDRGYLSELLEIYVDKKIKGEVTIVIAGNNPKFARMIESSGER